MLGLKRLKTLKILKKNISITKTFNKFSMYKYIQTSTDNINDRNNRLIELELMQFDTKLYKLFLYSTTTFIFKLLYFFPNLGKTIVNLKKRIIEKSIL